MKYLVKCVPSCKLENERNQNVPDVESIIEFMEKNSKIRNIFVKHNETVW